MTKEHEAYIEEYVKVFTHSTTEEIEFIKPHLVVREYKKRAFFLSSGEVQTEMGFVAKGLLRRYYINRKGSEITTGFVKEGEYATDYPAFIKQRKTRFHIQCLEPSTIICLPYEKIQESYTTSTNGQLYGRLIAEEVLTILNDRLEGFLFNTAEERYQKFVAENPELVHRVSLTHLASLLGIERQSLSRIRQKLAKS